jgi:transposase-like protein
MPPSNPFSVAHIRQAENMQLPLTALEAIVTIRRYLDELERQAVDGALERGATWQMIADTLGVSKQAANQRLRKQLSQVPSPEPSGATILPVAAEPPVA